MFVLAHLRDEAHRFAGTFHRKQRKRRTLRSALAEIPGIGPIRQRKMLAHFGSLKKVGEATLEELLAAPGMTEAAAAAVYEYFADRRSLPPVSTQAEATGSSESGRTPENQQVVRLFTDSVSSWYRKRHKARGLPDGETGAVTVIQRANSDLRLSPHFHTLFLDGVFSADIDGKGRMFHPAPVPSQEEVEALSQQVPHPEGRFDLLTPLFTALAGVATSRCKSRDRRGRHRY